MTAWREKYRPHTVADLVGCEQFKQDAQDWSLETAPPCLLFIGGPGVGKTTAARALARDWLGEWFGQENFITTNASDDRGIGYVRDHLKHISRLKGLMVAKRVIFLDEADSLTKDAQKALRQIMEDSHDTIIWILAGNDISAFHKAIKDRCTTYEFKTHGPNEIEEACLKIHEAEGLPEEWKQYYRNLAPLCDGSLRQTVDTLQSLSKTPEALEKRVRSSGQDMSRAALHLAAGDFTTLNAFLNQQLEKGDSRFYLLKTLRYKAKGLIEEGDDWFAFMKTYGDFMMMATQWPDDDMAFFEYFVATLQQNRRLHK